MTNRIALCLFAAVVILAPFVPGFPPFWIILLDNIGLAAIVAIGLVVLTGVGGLTSFGQAALAGFGAYSAAVLTTHYGWSPIATLPVALAVSALAALLLGFVIGLKGFVAAIIGGLASYPLTAAAALAVGLIESFSSFFASDYKEVIVFTLLIPVLLVRSFASKHTDEED